MTISPLLQKLLGWARHVKARHYMLIFPSCLQRRMKNECLTRNLYSRHRNLHAVLMYGGSESDRRFGNIRVDIDVILSLSCPCA
jgi:hypothetical protein